MEEKKTKRLKDIHLEAEVKIYTDDRLKTAKGRKEFREFNRRRQELFQQIEANP